MKAVAYCRVSTDGQIGEDRFGIPAQREQIQNYCDQKGIEIVGWFIDEGVSGAKERRPEFDKILQGAVTNPPIDYVVVAKTDRISRDINLYYAYKNLLQKQGLEILSVAEDWSNQDKLTAMILENFLAMAATVERENIRVRTSSGRSLKARSGGYAGGRRPYGYSVQDGKLVIDETEAKAVRLIFGMKDRGETFQAICEALNKSGFVTKSGKPFVISTIQVILGNRPVYEGKYKYGKDSEWVPGAHKAILEAAR